MRHDEVRDVTAHRLEKVCRDVAVGPMQEYLFGSGPGRGGEELVSQQQGPAS